MFSSHAIHVLFRLSWVQFVTRYRGALFGVFWALLIPLLMLAILTVVFSVIFPSRWGSDIDINVPFAALLFSGLLVHSMCAEVITRSTICITENPNYVKKVLFPLELLPIVIVVGAAIQGLIGFLILLALIILYTGELPMEVIVVPLLLVPYFVFLMGVSWILASIGTFAKDVGHVAGLLVTLLLFVSPILYPVNALPDWMQPYMYLNPLTFVVEEIRQLVIFGKISPVSQYFTYYAAAIASAGVGFKVFECSKRHFADVI